MNIQNVACFTGHRPKFLPWGYDENNKICLNFKKDLKRILCGAIEYGLTTFLTGMAEGFDMLASEAIIELKASYHIKIIAVIPCKNQSNKWSEKQKKRYKKILDSCDEQIIISDNYTPSCMHDRNIYMVEHSSVCIACFNGRPSGTANTIRLAREKGLKIRIINPENYK